MQIKLITPPTKKPISLSEVKSYCRIIGDDQDDVIKQLIDIAVGVFENYTSRQLCEAEYEIVTNGSVVLPKSPLVEIVSASSEYTLTYDYDVVTVNCADVTTIRFKAGYEKVPDEIIGWLLNKVATLYEYRENFAQGTIVSKFPENHVDYIMEMFKVRTWEVAN